MLLRLKQIKGQGRGHEVGFPTINVQVPENLDLMEGIYAAWVDIEGVTYKGALHYGSIPTFNLKTYTMEVHLIGITDTTVPDTNDKLIEVDIVERIRDIKKFDSIGDLAIQIEKDVLHIDKILR